MSRRWGLIVVALVVSAAGWPLHDAGLARGQATATTETVDLVRGCTNVSLTWPAGTSIAAVAAAVAPAAALQAIWRLDAVAQAYRGYAPGGAEVSDLTTVQPLDAVYLCANAPAVLTRPILGAPLVAVTAAPAVAPVAFRIADYTPVVGVGASASVRAFTRPGDICDIEVVPPLGSPAITLGLGPRQADITGSVLWLWTVPPGTLPGNMSVTVSCQNVRLSVLMRVV